jgi:hypothetical protein
MLEKSERTSFQADWQKVYMAAVSETDLKKAYARIREAENAIYSLFPDITDTSDLIREHEIVANALSRLRALEKISVR